MLTSRLAFLVLAGSSLVFAAGCGGATTSDEDDDTADSELRAQPTVGKVMSFSILGCADAICSVNLVVDAVPVKDDVDTVAFSIWEQNGPISNRRDAVLHRERGGSLLLESGEYRVRLTPGGADAAAFDIEVLAVAPRAGSLASLSFKSASAGWVTRYLSSGGPVLFDKLNILPKIDGRIFRKEFGKEGDPIHLSAMRYQTRLQRPGAFENGVSLTLDHARLVKTTKTDFTVQRSIRGADARALFYSLPNNGETPDTPRGFDSAAADEGTTGNLTCTLLPSPKCIATVTTDRATF